MAAVLALRKDTVSLPALLARKSTLPQPSVPACQFRASHLPALRFFFP